MLKKILLAFLITSNAFAKPNALETYKDYWSSFDSYEEISLQNSKNKLIESWDKIRQEYRSEIELFDDLQIEKIQQTISKYENELTLNTSPHLKADILLNLAILNDSLANILYQRQNSSYMEYKQAALAQISAIESSTFSKKKKDEALYLKATILTSLKDIKGALKVWKLLVANNSVTTYGVYANMALGDYYFNNGENTPAKNYYIKAQKIQNKISNIQTKEKTRVLYRIAWASYRSADTKLVIKTAFNLLNPEKHYTNVMVKNLVTTDAVELLSHALYEENDINLIENTLSKNSLKSKMSEVALSLMQKYAAVDLNNEVSEIGLFTLNRNSLEASSPQIMWLTALSLKKQNLHEEYISQLKNLVAISSRTSLWRIRNKSNLKAIKELEKIAVKATKRLAKHFYQYAMTHNSPSAYRDSAEYFTILKDGNHESSTSMLKIANAYLLANDLDKAIDAYGKVIANTQASAEDSKSALYLKAVALEKKWRMLMSSQIKGNSQKTLSQMSDTISSYSNKYTTSNKQKDLLRLLATSYQDNGEFEKSANVWDRILLSKPSQSLRATAIRGIILANVKLASTDEVIEKTENFLDLENWNKLPKSLKLELLGILQEYISKKSKNLRKNKVAQANFLMTTAKDYPELPDHHNIWLNAAYAYAKALKWKKAHDAAEEYLDKYSKNDEGSMAYLLAKSSDYLLDFETAIKEYKLFSTSYPKHPKVEKSLERAVKLAEFNDDYDSIISLSKEVASNTTRKNKKKRYLIKAAHYLAKKKEYVAAVKALRKASTLSDTSKEKYKISLEIAKNLGEFDLNGANKLLADTIYKIKVQKRKLGTNSYQDLLAQAYLMMNKKTEDDFSKIKITKNTKNPSSLITKKLNLFNKSMNQLNKVIKTNSPSWSAQARYIGAKNADEISSELMFISLKETKNRLKKNKYRQRSKRLRVFSQKLYSQNVLAEKKYPILKKSEWVKKSHIKLSGLKKSKVYSFNKMFQIDLDKSRY